jgi:hypothetical protein
MSGTNNNARFQILDKLIADYKPRDSPHYFSISYADLDEGQKLFYRMEKYTAPYYEIFGGNGYNSFGLYKSSENKIYVISVDFQTPTGYAIINSVSDLS